MGTEINLMVARASEMTRAAETTTDGWMIWGIIAICLIPIIIFLTFYITRKLIEKQLKQNPPISEAQIRAMFMSMGRKPSEAQIRNTMNSMKNAKGNNYQKRK